MPNYIHSFELFEWVCHWKSVLKIFNSHNIICINFLNEFLVLDQSDERTEKAYCTAAELTLFYVCCCSLSYFFKEQSWAINNAKHNRMKWFLKKKSFHPNWAGLALLSSKQLQKAPRTFLFSYSNFNFNFHLFSLNIKPLRPMTAHFCHLMKADPAGINCCKFLAFSTISVVFQRCKLQY